MNPLESRKRLLVAESELNRAQLSQEWVAMTMGVRKLTGHVNSFSSIASVAALLVAGVMAFRRVKSVSANTKPSWLRTVLKGTSLVSSFWRPYRAKGHNHENKQPTSRA